MKALNALNYCLSTSSIQRKIVISDDVTKFKIICGNIDPKSVYLDEPMLKNPNLPYDAIYFDKEYRGLYKIED